MLLLCHNAIQLEERRSHIYANDSEVPAHSDQSDVEAYREDIVVKSHKGFDLLTDLAETFANLRRYDIKLNPSKCTFGIPSGKLLGFLVSE